VGKTTTTINLGAAHRYERAGHSSADRPDGVPWLMIGEDPSSAPNGGYRV
jgi:hypothetical protein